MNNSDIQHGYLALYVQAFQMAWHAITTMYVPGTLPAHVLHKGSRGPHLGTSAENLAARPDSASSVRISSHCVYSTARLALRSLSSSTAAVFPLGLHCQRPSVPNDLRPIQIRQSSLQLCCCSSVSSHPPCCVLYMCPGHYPVLT